jgi:hypothetical protein
LTAHWVNKANVGLAVFSFGKHAASCPVRHGAATTATNTTTTTYATNATTNGLTFNSSGGSFGSTKKHGASHLVHLGYFVLELLLNKIALLPSANLHFAFHAKHASNAALGVVHTP